MEEKDSGKPKPPNLGPYYTHSVAMGLFVWVSELKPAHHNPRTSNTTIKPQGLGLGFRV